MLTHFKLSCCADSPGYSDELKTSLAEQVMGARLLLGEDKKDMFDAQIAFEIACKVSPLYMTTY